MTDEIWNSLSSLADKFETFREKVRNGEYGKTARFWTMYLDIFRVQRMSHIAIHENNFDLRLKSWEWMIPLYFSLNMTNYARYGSYYVEILNCMNKLYPGMKDLLKHSRLSSEGQSRYLLQTAL